MQFFEKNKQRLLEEIVELLKIPSISTRDENKKDIAAAANWVEKKLQQMGMDNVTQVTVNGGNPVIVAEKIFDNNLPTLLVYGHYDVQPAEPLEEWQSSPFEPEIREGAIYGRGTTDNKAQFLTNFAALEYYLSEQTNKTWNIKVAIEGEEEIGGPSIDAMIVDPHYSEHFKADYAYISDGPWVKNDVPSIEFSLRGLVYFDLTLRTSRSDMHSGLFGNSVMNPANLAGYVIYKLKDVLANRIKVANIYKQVRKLSEEEIESINTGSMSWADVKEHSGAFVITPTRKDGKLMTPAVLTGTKPSLDVHGISTGFTEVGRMKTVIPATAFVKFSIRLVPFMNPDEVVALVEKYVKKIMPKNVEYELVCLSKGKPYLTDPNDERVRHLIASYETAFGKSPVLAPSGGSIGLVTTLAEAHGVKSLLASYGLPDDRLHGPNEKYNLSQFEGGFRTLVEFLKQ